MECIFCKIVRSELPSEIILENKEVVVFKDINPKARIHVLVVPKKHIVGVQTMTEADQELVGKLVFTAKEVATKLGVLKTGFKLKIHVGKGGGQEVDHLHLHLLAN